MLKFGQMKAFNGRICGFRHPSIAVPLLPGGNKETLPQDIGNLVDFLAKSMGLEAKLWFTSALTPENLGKDDWFLPLLSGLHIEVGLPEVRHMTINVGEQKATYVICEAFDPAFLLKSLKFLQISFSGSDLIAEHIISEFDVLKNSASSIAKSGTNIRHLVKAAWALDIPVCVLPDLTVNFGMGAQALAMHSSVTERTGALAVNRARDKAATHQFMAMLGIPVTEQRVARTMEQARQFVQSNGYPVVVKPRALDGGEGVTTEIRSDEALGQALQKVAALSQTALIERQLLGEEYRLLYVKGKLISVHERVPAHVAGNGRDTVQELVDAENVRRGAAAQTGFTNIPIHLGEDALNQLSAQGLDLSSIPETGRIVRLATVPMVRTGGAVRSAIDPSKIHPQILSDARNVVRMVGLDVAGVDIITTDLGKPLQETGGAITEVNAKPQIVRFEAFDVHARVLQALLNGNGRIPCVLILADNETAAPLLSVLADRQGALLESTGLLLADKDLSADVKARFGCVAALKGLPALLAHPDMCSIVAVAPMSHVVANGYPLDRSHLTVILDDLRRTQVAEMASPLLRPHIAGPIFLPSGTEAASAFSAAVPPMKYSTFDDIEFLSQQIAAVLRKGVTLRSDAIAAAGRP